MVLLGNYNRERLFNVMGRINSDQGRPYVFFRNYEPDLAVVDTTPMYSDYTKNVPAGNPGYNGTTLAGQDVYSRTNKVFGMGIDYKF